jgi:hypothetical protein
MVVVVVVMMWLARCEFERKGEKGKRRTGFERRRMVMMMMR